MAMTEAATEATPQVTLVQYGLYSHDGMVRFASDENTLVDLTGNVGTTYTPDINTTLFASPGTQDWIDRMVRVRYSQASTISNLTERNRSIGEERDHLNSHLEGLGEAIKEKAEEHRWCEEYEAFAEEWGLPKRSQDFDITVTIRINAADEESALEMVRGNFGLSDYSEGVVEGPEFEASEA